MALITSKVVTGNFTVGSNWVGEVAPVSGVDDIIISAGADITQDDATGPFQAGFCTVYAGARFFIEEPFQITDNAVNSFYVQGEVEVNNILTIGSSGVTANILYLLAGGKLWVNPASITRDVDIIFYGGATMWGHYAIGTKATPIPAQYTVRRLLRSIGTTDFTWSKGWTHIEHGVPKTVVQRIASDVAPDDFTMQVEDADPTGWAPDDRIWLSSMAVSIGGTSEVASVDSISGTTLTVKDGEGTAGAVLLNKYNAVTDKYGQFIINGPMNVQSINENVKAGGNQYTYDKHQFDTTGENPKLFLDYCSYDSCGGTAAQNAATTIDMDYSISGQPTAECLIGNVAYITCEGFNRALDALSIDIDNYNDRDYGIIEFFGQIGMAGFETGLYVTAMTIGSPTFIDFTGCEMWIMGSQATILDEGSAGLYCTQSWSNKMPIPYMNIQGYGARHVLVSGSFLTKIVEELVIVGPGHAFQTSAQTVIQTQGGVDIASAQNDFHFGTVHAFCTRSTSNEQGVLSQAHGRLSIGVFNCHGYYSLFAPIQNVELTFGEVNISKFNLDPVITESDSHVVLSGTITFYPEKFGMFTIRKLNFIDTPILPMITSGITWNQDDTPIYIEEVTLNGFSNDLVTVSRFVSNHPSDVFYKGSDAKIILGNIDGENVRLETSINGVKSSMAYASKIPHTEGVVDIAFDPVFTTKGNAQFTSFAVATVVGANSVDIYLAQETASWDGDIEIMYGWKGGSLVEDGDVLALSDAELTISDYDGTDIGWSKNTVDLGTRTKAGLEIVTIAVVDGSINPGVVYAVIAGVGETTPILGGGVSIIGGGGVGQGVCIVSF